MTEQEKAVMHQIVELWGSFLKLPIVHSDDAGDFCFYIHRMQEMIAARQALLNYKKNGE